MAEDSIVRFKCFLDSTNLFNDKLTDIIKPFLLKTGSLDLKLHILR